MKQLKGEESCCYQGQRKHKLPLLLVLVLVVGSIVIVSLLREKIVGTGKDKVVISGEGRVAYQPDIANVSLGVQIDKAATAQEALDNLNKKMGAVISAMESINIPKNNIQTQNYSLYPQYDYKDGVSVQSGYNATQQVNVKVEKIQENSQLLSQVISKASEAGTNQVNGISFDVSNLDDFRQQARIEAIQDAKKKSVEMGNAAGVKIGKLLGWNESYSGDPGIIQPMYYDLGGRGGAESRPAADVPSGTQEIVVRVDVSFEIN